MALTVHRLATPDGAFRIVVNDDGHAVRSGWFDDDELDDAADGMPVIEWADDLARAPSIVSRIAAALAGDAVSFDDQPTPAGPPFYRACWTVCRAIPRGAVIDYAELAARADSPLAARAAGQAMRNNPLPIIVPCHRVTSASGGLGGFAGTTDPATRPMQRKRWLLTMEGALPSADTQDDEDPSRFAGLARTVDQ